MQRAVRGRPHRGKDVTGVTPRVVAIHVADGLSGQATIAHRVWTGRSVADARKTPFLWMLTGTSVHGPQCISSETGETSEAVSVTGMEPIPVGVQEARKAASMAIWPSTPRHRTAASAVVPPRIRLAKSQVYRAIFGIRDISEIHQLHGRISHTPQVNR